MMFQQTLPIPDINRIHESPRLTEFKRVRQQFRFLMHSLLDDGQADIDRIWDRIIEVFDIPVKEWGKYPSDEVVDANYSTADFEYYTIATTPQMSSFCLSVTTKRIVRKTTNGLPTFGNTSL